MDFVEGGVVNFKEQGFKDFLVRYWLFFGLSFKRRVLTVPFVEI